MKVSDYVIDRIAKEVKHVFLLPGGGCIHLIDSIGKRTDLTYINNLHEQACAIAADAYGQYTNNLGVAIVTTGPGGTNAITGVVASFMESTPVLIISGQVQRKDMTDRYLGPRQRGFQEVPIVDMVKPITKYAVTIRDAQEIQFQIEKALCIARQDRPGPVWLDIPLDVQAADVDIDPDYEFNTNYYQPSKVPPLSSFTINQTIEWINQAERPVILAGNGIRLSKAKREFLLLLELLKFPVLTTWKMMDYFDERDYLYFGRPGIVGQRTANFIQQNSDLLLCLGTRLDLGQVAYRYDNFAPKAKKIVIEIDEREAGKYTGLDNYYPVIADVKTFMQRLLEKSKLIQKLNLTWINQCSLWKQDYPITSEGLYAFMDELSKRLLPTDILIPASSGQASEVTMQAFKVKEGQRIFSSNGLGAMGFGLPAAIGACLASGGRRTICIEGDGGIQLNMQELMTIKNLDLPIKIFVLNNHGYGSIRATQRSMFEGRYVASQFDLPNMLAIADAYDIWHFYAEDKDQYAKVIEKAFYFSMPTLCVIDIPDDQPTIPRVTSKLVDGKMQTMPMEDMYPFLDREEFERNMKW